ncbi:hypothetical protein N665_0012s0019 [Sinapis alba]|nr:hypothetical protein N665_0012s0019 [Sinapis alba]KAF8117003.1 hypothetical protein N665_0012s0019 [Sinapis alba]
MLEDRSPDSCLSSRVFSSSRISESTWSAKSFMFPDDDANGKRALEVVSEIRPTKSLKLMGFSIQYDSDSSDYSGTSQEQDQADSNNNNNGGDSTDSHSLFNEIGRDNSIDCLIRCSRSDYGSIASLNRNFRSLVKSGDVYRLRRQNGFVEHWVYFSCQPLEWVAFDPVERRWMQLPTMPSSVTFMGADKESLAVGTDLLVLGQAGFSSYVIYRYSLLTNSWSSGMNMNSPRCLFGSASLGEIAIFAGGIDSQRKILDFAEMYNSELQTWTTLPRMNKPRKMCSGVFMDGKFYVIGGIGGPDSKVLTCGEEYDLETKKWTQIPDLSPPRSRADMSSANDAPPLVAVVNNQLYAADHADMEVRKYDKEKKKWLTVGRLPERAGSVNGWGLAFRACGERLIVIGGPRNSGGGFIELNSWIPSNGDPPQWTLLDRKHSPNFVYNCAVMGC